jgi:serine/threonine protein phosphatase PrpC
MPNIVTSAYSAPSRTRNNLPNQDAYSIVEYGHHGTEATAPEIFLAVADGMTTLDDPSLASQIAVRIGASHFLLERSITPNFCRLIILEANDDLLDKRPLDMGTTLTFAAIQNSRLFYGHIGDCRLYLIRGTSIECLTRDDSKLAKRIDKANPSKSEAKDSKDSKKLLRSLGEKALESADVHVGEVPLNPKDVVVICSDGVWSEFDPSELIDQIGSEILPTTAQRIVERAIHLDPTDDATMVIAQLA